MVDGPSKRCRHVNTLNMNCTLETQIYRLRLVMGRHNADIYFMYLSTFIFVLTLIEECKENMRS